MAASNPRSVLIGLGVAAVVGAAGIGIAIHLASESKSEVSGSLTIDDGAFEPAHCRSGHLDEDAPRDRVTFRGVDLVGVGAGREVRVLEDPMRGMTVLVVDPGQAPREVERDGCDRFEVELRDTDEMIGDTWGMEGSIDLDCPAVSGRVTFSHCYGGR